MDRDRGADDLFTRVEHARHHIGERRLVAGVTVGHERADIDAAGPADQKFRAAEPECVAVQESRVAHRKGEMSVWVRKGGGRMHAAERTLARAWDHFSRRQAGFEGNAEILAMAGTGQAGHG